MPSDVVIALIGATGAGKSSFIQNVTGRNDIPIGHSLMSETEEVIPYRYHYGGINFILVDTPGFDDNRFNEDFVVTKVLTWLRESYSEGTRLNGLIYVHRIIDPRMQGTSLSNMRLFRRLCGPECFENIVLATSFWNCVDLTVGEKRERELCQNNQFWGELIKRKSRVVRIGNDASSDRKHLLSMAGNAKCTLAAQREMSEGKSILETAAMNGPNEDIGLWKQHYDQQLQVERLKLQQELRQQERLAKNRLAKQKEEMEQTRRERQAQARQQHETQKISSEKKYQEELRKRRKAEAQQDVKYHRLYTEHHKEEQCRKERQRKLRTELQQYYKNYTCRRRRVSEVRCNMCQTHLNARYHDYYRKSTVHLAFHSQGRVVSVSSFEDT